MGGACRVAAAILVSDELDLLASIKRGRYTLSAKYAGYDALAFATDTGKAWLSWTGRTEPRRVHCTKKCLRRLRLWRILIMFSGR